MFIRKLRLAKGWSQEQLAEMSGVSTRTIQRLERGGNASLESLKCLAAVFETDLNDLQKDDTMPSDTLSNDDRAALAQVREWMKYDNSSTAIDPSLSDEEQDAMEYVRDIKSFYSNLGSYVVMLVILLVINLLTSPGYLWVVWPALGWGIGVVFHGLSVFEIFSPMGSRWEKRQIEKRLRRSR
ncbi:MAG: helix-turn-helix domain-containing protein [Rhodobacteraceae bacterium]|nr:helix-turn-helix domain-containing protein [Paracoccaceae bacterium]